MSENANETVGISKKTITIIGIILILIIISSIIIYNVLKPKESKDKYDLEEQLTQGYKLNYYNVKEDISNFDDEWRKEDSDNDGINNEDEYTKYNTNPYLSL